MEQLVFVNENFPDLAARLAQTTPHCLNARDEHGDTFFHHLARDRRADEIKVWLEHGACVTPIANRLGHTAVMVAVDRHETGIAQAPWRELESPLNYITSSLVAEELKLLPISSPELVQPFLLDIE